MGSQKIHDQNSLAHGCENSGTDPLNQPLLNSKDSKVNMKELLSIQTFCRMNAQLNAQEETIGDLKEQIDLQG